MNSIRQRLSSAALALYLVLGCWKGYVALFESGSEEPRQIFPYQVSSLPPADQTALEEGIRVQDQEELTRLMEDFLS